MLLRSRADYVLRGFHYVMHVGFIESRCPGAVFKFYNTVLHVTKIYRSQRTHKSHTRKRRAVKCKCRARWSEDAKGVLRCELKIANTCVTSRKSEGQYRIYCGGKEG